MPVSTRSRRIAVYMVLVFQFLVCLLLIQRNSDRDNARARREESARVTAIQQENRDRFIQDCRSRREGREVLRDLVILSTSQDPIDFSKIPSFKSLAPEEQQFFRDLTEHLRSNGGGGSDFKDQALAKLTLPECPAG